MPQKPSILKKKETVVVKLSGSLFFSKEFDAVATVLRNILTKKRNLRLVIVAGGGRTAREYIEVASRFRADQASLDEIGIQASRLNAMVLIQALGDFAHSRVALTLAEVKQALEIPENRVVVLGGLHPGQSTNAVAALVSEKVGAMRFINATDTDAVYTKDPRKSSDAKPLSQVTTKQLSNILADESMHAGGYDLMDPIALKLIARSKIPTLITKCDPKTLRDSILGGKSPGTTILFS